MATEIYVGVNEVLAPEVSGETTSKSIAIEYPVRNDYCYFINQEPVFNDISTNEPIINGAIEELIKGIFNSGENSYGFYYDLNDIVIDDPDVPLSLYSLSNENEYSKEGAIWHKVTNVVKTSGEMETYTYNETPYTLKLQPPNVGGPGIARKVSKAYLGIGDKWILEEVPNSTETGVWDCTGLEYREYASQNTQPVDSSGNLVPWQIKRIMKYILADIKDTNSYIFVNFDSYILKFYNVTAATVTRAPEPEPGLTETSDYYNYTATKYILRAKPNSNGKARKVKKGYLGDSNGKARLFFSSGPKIVSWTTGSDEEVAAMITAAHNGEIKLADYWNIGDTRTVSLSAGTNSKGTAIPAQSVELVLAHKPTSTSYYGGGEFIINQKNCLSVGNYMNSSNINTGSFSGSAMASFLNNSSTGYLKMLPTWLSSVLLDAKVITAQTYNGTTNQKSTHKVFLPAAKEIFGGTATTAGSATSYSNLTEFNALEQWEWFKTTTNRIKQVNGTDNWWWERSPGYNSSSSFCGVRGGGGAGYSGAGGSFGVTPAMLI